jgi:hypothetical protein
MSDLDPKLRTALKDLASSLKRGGYARDECEAIVEGATERALAHTQSHPDAPVEDVLALIAEYKDPQFEPDTPGETQSAERHGRFAWIALALTLIGIAALAPLVSAWGGDGGTVMALFALIGLPVTGALAFFGRHARLGQTAGIVAAVLAAIVLVMGLLFF